MPSLVEIGFLAYYPILISNGLTILTCLIAGSREWSRRLCRGFLWLNALYLLLVTLFLIHFAITTGLRDEGGFGFGLILLGGSTIALEFLTLLAVWRIRVALPRGE